MTVSTETAARLNAAGFQQPEFAFGQLWETPNGREWAFVGTAQFHLLKQHFAKEIVFRPTATDILRELQSHKNYTYSIKIESGMWLVERTFNSIGEFPTLVSSHHNEHEAAAMAWLEIHEKTTAE